MNDTIAAIATPVGEGGVSIIRISGEQALPIASRLFHSRVRDSKEYRPHHVYFGEIRDPSTSRCVDEALIIFFKSPKSYTAEDVIEINTHGGVFVTSRILQLILDQGARLAEPGEFTRRAFLNGRIDLSQAEAVTDLIQASSERALRSAVSQLKGDLSRQLNSMYETLIGILAQLEASIDFSEEGLMFQKREKNLEALRKVQEELDTLIQSYRQGKIFREGASVALVGKPNVGKSSLLNALLKEDRAIVTPLPGTTRDTLEERVRVRDIHINIIDAAGLREHPEIIEEEGIHRARAALERADLALAIFDASQPLDSNDNLLIKEVLGKKKLVVLNKSDLPQNLDETELGTWFPETKPIKISAKALTGIGALSDAIYQLVVTEHSLQEGVIITRERHRQCLMDANHALKKSCETLEHGLSEEFVAVDINVAMDRLGLILGKTFEDDLLDQIFGEFCIGK